MKSTCRKTRKSLVAFLTRQLKEKNAREVAQHLAACTLCSREAEELQSTWKLIGEYPLDEGFTDITGVVLEKAKSAEDADTLIGKIINTVVRIPVPALCTFIAVLALPAGFYLGKHLHLDVSTTYTAYREKEIAAELDGLPLDIFNDFPEHSLGGIYENLANDN